MLWFCFVVDFLMRHDEMLYNKHTTCLVMNYYYIVLI